MKKYKICLKCNEKKCSENGYHKNHDNPDGLARWCKECMSLKKIAYTHASGRKTYRSSKGYLHPHASIDTYHVSEWQAWKKYRERATSFGIFLAPCRLLSNGCLMMMTVDTDSREEEELPNWATKIDCSQVGIYKERLVAYDYALELVERAAWEKEWKTTSRFFHANRLPYLRKLSEGGAET